MKNTQFKVAISQKIGPKLLLITNRNSYALSTGTKVVDLG